MSYQGADNLTAQGHLGLGILVGQGQGRKRKRTISSYTRKEQ